MESSTYQGVHPKISPCEASCSAAAHALQKSTLTPKRQQQQVQRPDD